MYLYKNLFIILLLSFSFSQKQTAIENNKVDQVKIWENDDDNIDNSELKKALAKLREEFEHQRKTIQKIQY